MGKRKLLVHIIWMIPRSLSKQNRCFKEVIKEHSEYEIASGAKVNYDKTKGLWAGSWKRRKTSPTDIKWTNKNVENLGIFFGNDNSALATYNKCICTKTKKTWIFSLTQDFSRVNPGFLSVSRKPGFSRENPGFLSTWTNNLGVLSARFRKIDETIKLRK